MVVTSNVIVLCAALLGGILICMEAGKRIGALIHAREGGKELKGLSSVEGATVGLLGLLIAFSFSGAATRFEARRFLITQEANAIGTAYLRIELLAPDARKPMRDLFRRYLDTRLDTYKNMDDPSIVQAKFNAGAALQTEIWTTAVSAVQESGAAPQAGMLLLPALNEMIDITTTRLEAGRNHPPLVIHFLLAALSLIGALLSGYNMSDDRIRSWLHMIVFAVIMSITLYVILDLEYPRQGLIRVDAADQVLLELRQSLQ